MARVTGFNAERCKEIEDTNVRDGEIRQVVRPGYNKAHLFLKPFNRPEIDAGELPPGPPGPPGRIQSINGDTGPNVIINPETLNVNKELTRNNHSGDFMGQIGRFTVDRLWPPTIYCIYDGYRWNLITTLKSKHKESDIHGCIEDYWNKLKYIWGSTTQAFNRGPARDTMQVQDYLADGVNGTGWSFSIQTGGIIKITRQPGVTLAKTYKDSGVYVTGTSHRKQERDNDILFAGSRIDVDTPLHGTRAQRLKVTVQGRLIVGNAATQELWQERRQQQIEELQAANPEMTSEEMDFAISELPPPELTEEEFVEGDPNYEDENALVRVGCCVSQRTGSVLPTWPRYVNVSGDFSTGGSGSITTNDSDVRNHFDLFATRKSGAIHVDFEITQLAGLDTGFMVRCDSRCGQFYDNNAYDGSIWDRKSLTKTTRQMNNDEGFRITVDGAGYFSWAALMKIEAV